MIESCPCIKEERFFDYNPEGRCVPSGWQQFKLS
jgi:hypothetical protein